MCPAGIDDVSSHLLTIPDSDVNTAAQLGKKDPCGKQRFNRLGYCLHSYSEATGIPIALNDEQLASTGWMLYLDDDTERNIILEVEGTLSVFSQDYPDVRNETPFQAVQNSLCELTGKSAMAGSFVALNILLTRETKKRKEKTPGPHKKTMEQIEACSKSADRDCADANSKAWASGMKVQIRRVWHGGDNGGIC